MISTTNLLFLFTVATDRVGMSHQLRRNSSKELSNTPATVNVMTELISIPPQIDNAPGRLTKIRTNRG
ncbi:protein of unknown function [Nitrospira japonica]|uniref:Uncharacterized protein n=1 Tax=Nitrospira japonica TaxID=1325564 RepID=A0A1W1I0V2_9BACT|nr:protein of unknown function [Nitrospira japonica]